MVYRFSPNRPTGPIWSSSRDVRPLLSPSHTILSGEQRRSKGLLSTGPIPSSLLSLLEWALKCCYNARILIRPCLAKNTSNHITLKLGLETWQWGWTVSFESRVHWEDHPWGSTMRVHHEGPLWRSSMRVHCEGHPLRGRGFNVQGEFSGFVTVRVHCER